MSVIRSSKCLFCLSISLCLSSIKISLLTCFLLALADHMRFRGLEIDNRSDVVQSLLLKLFVLLFLLLLDDSITSFHNCRPHFLS